jgi:predicted acylesterase/phospholipase RssA
MKGGITSGIVYPAAILRLKDKYRFRNIGGTSAGAMAAALTAAAEYGRQAVTQDGPWLEGGNENQGFAGLKKTRDELCQPGLLLGLFQPSRPTRSLFRFLLYLKTGPVPPRSIPLSWLYPVHRALWKCGALIYAVGVIASIAAVSVVTVVAARIFRVGHFWVPPSQWDLISWLIALTILFLAAALLGPLIPLWHLGRTLVDRVPANLFGLCTGLRTGPSGHAAVTEWLHERIQMLAGLPNDKPLTFGMLWDAGREKPAESSRDRTVNLQVVTSCLSHGQPYTLPFEGELFAFKKDELALLLPEAVMKHLVQPQDEIRAYCRLPEGYHFLPEARHLPVLLASRMSLSFPLLFSGVPLYAIRHDRGVQARTSGATITLDPETDLQRLWFSDGGICSNFPIHFFDAWLPRRPTFGISLTNLPKESIKKGQVSQQYMSYSAKQWRSPGMRPSSNEAAIYQSVYMPRPDDQQSPEWIPFTSVPTDPGSRNNLLKFLTAIFTTAQNYRDNSQSLLPSYRERVVQIRLEEGEGGLNLAMDSSTIAKIVDKGDQAGEALCDSFDFRIHQWVRFRVLMSRLEERLALMREVFEDPAFNHAGLLQEQLGGEGIPRFPFSLSDPWPTKALARLEYLIKLLDEWKEGGAVFDQAAPEPKPTLRVVPQA